MSFLFQNRNLILHLFLVFKVNILIKNRAFLVRTLHYLSERINYRAMSPNSLTYWITMLDISYHLQWILQHRNQSRNTGCPKLSPVRVVPNVEVRLWDWKSQGIQASMPPFSASVRPVPWIWYHSRFRIRSCKTPCLLPRSHPPY